LLFSKSHIMNEKIRDQYDSLYASKVNVYGGGKPIESVCKLGDYLSGGKVLDIGGGEGRNALYLAQQGFFVSVTDLSKVGLERLKSIAEEKDFNINTRVTDVTAEGIDGMYDSVILSFVLHHMNDEDAKKIIVEAQQHTIGGGVHVLSTFSNQGGLYDRNIKTGRFYPSEETLKELYVDWNIKELSSKEMTAHARNKNGERMKNFVVTLIALKNK